MALEDNEVNVGLVGIDDYTDLDRPNRQVNQQPLGAGLVNPIRQKLGGNAFQRNRQGAISNALSRFDQSFQHVNLAQGSLNNATDFGRPGSGINNTVNNSINRFDDAFENTNSIFSRYY